MQVLDIKGKNLRTRLAHKNRAGVVFVLDGLSFSWDVERPCIDGGFQATRRHLSRLI